MTCPLKILRVERKVMNVKEANLWLWSILDYGMSQTRWRQKAVQEF